MKSNFQCFEIKKVFGQESVSGQKRLETVRNREGTPEQRTKKQRTKMKELIFVPIMKQDTCKFKNAVFNDSNKFTLKFQKIKFVKL